MPSVSLLNTEWRKVCDSIKLSLKEISLKEQRIIKEVSSLLEPYEFGSEPITLNQLRRIDYWAKERYTYTYKNMTVSNTELHKLWDTIKKLEELNKRAQKLQAEYQELKEIYKKLEEASLKRNKFFETPVGSSSGSSSSSSNSIDDVILTDPWGY